MITFRSFKNIQEIEMKKILRIEIKQINSRTQESNFKFENRIKPTPPNFNKIPASSIEPKTGAST